jgi:peroxiredoxin
MALTYSEKGALGSLAPDFNLLGTDEVHHGLRDFRNARVLVVVFMCNHCPYVKAVRQRINRLALEGAEHGVLVVGINSNDSVKYPADNFEAMKREAHEQSYAFKYLWDETQQVAKAYGAVCTPDFYVFRNDTGHKDPVEFRLRYRGRLDDNWQDESKVSSQDLKTAIAAILKGNEPAMPQRSSMGCSIKWAEPATSPRT